jgi:hypothetical protein
LESDGGEEHPPEDAPKLGLWQGLHDPVAHEDSGEGGREHAEDFPPEGVLAEGTDGAEVTKNEERKEDTGAFLGGEGLSHECYGEEADAREPAFGEANAEGGTEAEEPEHEGWAWVERERLW